MRKEIVTFYCLFICSLFTTRFLYAQNTSFDSLTYKMGLYSKKNPSSILFAHFDKTIYVNNENVWFTAYLLNYNKQTNNPSILSVLLINDHNKSQLLEQKFVMAGGLAFGSVFIPDSIPPGDYSFILYTNVLTNGKPDDVFTQPITIKATSKPAITAALNLIDTTALVTGGFRKILFGAATKDGRPIQNAEMVYHIGNYQHPVLSGKIRTDKDGQCIFSIPANQIIAGENVIEASIKYNKDVSNTRLTLHVAENKFSIKFYPEGGNLVHATQSLVGWEAKDAYGAPLKITGVLYEDKRIIDTIHTNDYGMGRFKLVPLMGSDYEVKLIEPTKDAIFHLPKILPKGPVISIKSAIANDTLKIRLVSKYPGKLFLMVHNYRQTFSITPVEVGAAGKTVLVILKDIPKGLNAITILDSLQRPYSERIFFAHYNQRTSINIFTDSSTYKTRQKVKLKLKLSSTNDTLKGMVSIACVQSNRVEIKKAIDIESYVYLKDELENIPLKEKYMGQGTDDKSYLENVLLIKGWRRYNWEEMVQISAKDTLKQINNLEYKGAVYQYEKELKKPAKLFVMADSTNIVIITGKTGKFKLNTNDIITSDGKKVYLILKGNNEGYSVKIIDPFIPTSSLLLKDFQKEKFNSFSFSEFKSDSSFLTGFAHTINLKGVTIKAVKDENFNNSYRLKNVCGDYVCRYNFLNCPVHPHEIDNRPPIVGETYHQQFNNNVVYKGCAVVPNSNATMKGVSYSKEFYGSDYSQLNPSQPEYLSTIYWKHLCLVNSKGDIELSFYTSDITGPFKIIVQGVTANDVIYGEKEFNVESLKYESRP